MEQKGARMMAGRNLVAKPPPLLGLLGIDWFGKLPVELWAKILADFRHPPKLAQLERVSKEFQKIVLDVGWTQIRQLHFCLETSPPHLADHRPGIINVIVDGGKFEKEGVDLALGFFVPQLIRKTAQKLQELELEFSLGPSALKPSVIDKHFHHLQQAVLQCQQLEELHLEFLDRSYTRDCLSPMLRPGTLTNLQTLAVMGDFQRPLKGLPLALFSSGAQLKSLELQLGCSFNSFFGRYSKLIQMGQSHPLQTLNDLTIQINQESEMGDSQLILDSCPTLSTCSILFFPPMPKAASLSAIRAFVHSVLRSDERQLNLDCSLMEEDMYEEDWKPLESQLRRSLPQLVVNYDLENKRAEFENGGSRVRLEITDAVDDESISGILSEYFDQEDTFFDFYDEYDMYDDWDEEGEWDGGEEDD